MSSDTEAATAKFTGLAVGARFRLRGICYQKVSPLIARNEATGQSQMIPRAAWVEPLDAASAAAGAPAGQVQGVLEEYHRAALHCLDSLAGTDSAPELAAARKRLEDAYRRALKKLLR